MTILKEQIIDIIVEFSKREKKTEHMFKAVRDLWVSAVADGILPESSKSIWEGLEFKSFHAYLEEARCRRVDEDPNKFWFWTEDGINKDRKIYKTRASMPRKPNVYFYMDSLTLVE